MRTKLCIYLCLLLLVLSACSPTKYLKKGEYLLQNNTVSVPNKAIDKSEVLTYCKQKPNRTILAYPIYAALYNMVNPQKEAEKEKQRRIKEAQTRKKRIQKGKTPRKKRPFYLRKWWREKIGEKPIVYNEELTKQSKKNILAYMCNLGYYDAEVSHYLNYRHKRKRVKVHYNIKANKLYTINIFDKNIPDARIDSIIEQMPEWQQFESGQAFNSIKIDALRYNISQTLQNNGYYDFGPNQVVFYADSNQNSKQVNVNLQLLRASDSGYVALDTILPIAFISDLNILSYPYDLSDLDKKTLSQQTYGEDSLSFLHYDELYFKPHILHRRMEFKKGDVFSQHKIRRTAFYINSLGIFNAVNIKYKNDTTLRTSKAITMPLLVDINLMPRDKQMYTVDVEGYTSSGILGTALKFSYGHINLFKRAISFKLELKGKLERSAEYQIVEQSSNLYAYEYGAHSSLRFPSFFSPFKLRQFNKRYFPATNVSVDYNQKSRFEYTRETSSVGFGYSWSTPKGLKHFLNPVDFYFTRFNAIKSNYLDYLVSKNLMARYFDHVLTAGNYSIFYNSKQNEQQNSYFSINFRFEMAGNLLNAMQSILKSPKKGRGDLNYELNKAYVEDSYPANEQQYILDSLTFAMNASNPHYYTFDGVLYYQYLKGDIDFRYYWNLGKHVSIAGRFFSGVIFPYGNTKKMTPIERQYFVGGSNDMRAWWVRSLGPGAYRLNKSESQINNFYQSGDIKLLGSLELRHDLVWLIKGALFADVGNVWDMFPNENIPEGVFKPDSFYKQLAIGAGYGLRFDLSFFVIRFDLAFKLRDPSLKGESKWVRAYDDKNLRKPVFNFGIGYPF